MKKDREQDQTRLGVDKVKPKGWFKSFLEQTNKGTLNIFGHPYFMLKSYEWVNDGGWVAYRMLLSAPVLFGSIWVLKWVGIKSGGIGD